VGVLDPFRSVSREPSRATLTARGIAALVTLVVLVASLYLYGQGAFRDEWKAVALVDTAGGSLVVGSDVKYDGVVVGEVAALSFDPAGPGAGPDTGNGSGTRIDLKLKPGLAEDVPADVKARVLPASVFGTSFVDLVSSGTDAGTLDEGAQIPQDLSRRTLELQDVLDGLDTVIDDLGPAELASSLEALAGALDGNGEQLGRTIEQITAYLGKLNPAMPVVRRNLELLATNLEAFQAYAPDLFAATDNALVAARTLVEQEDDLRALARSGADTMTDVDRLLTANEQRLVDALVRTAVTVDSVYDGRQALTRGVLSFLDLAERMVPALQEGNYLKIDGNLVTGEEEPYGPEDCPQYGSQRGRGC
jgi:virulence factor Mce-like protein